MKNDIFRFVALPPDARRSSPDTGTIRPVPAELRLTDVPNRKVAARSVADRGHGRAPPGWSSPPQVRSHLRAPSDYCCVKGNLRELTSFCRRIPCVSNESC